MPEQIPMLDGLNPVERAAVRDTIAKNPELGQLPQELQGDALTSILDAVRAQRQAAHAIIGELEKSRDKIVTERRDVEARWAEDVNQYEGENLVLKDSKEYSTDKGHERETKAKVNLTRARTNMAAARIADMLFPANDRNWDIQPLNNRLRVALDDGEAQAQVQGQQGTPLQQDGQPQADGTQAPQQGPDDKDRCDAMRETIQNELDESNYSEHGRRIIEDGCKIGIGVMKGPFTRLVKRKKFGFQQAADGRTVAILDVVERRRPRCTRVDPRFFYPQSVPDMEQCERAFELHLMSRAELKELARQDGVDAPAVELLLTQTPQLGRVGENLIEWNKHCVLKDGLEDKYAVWEMHGVLSKEELEALGMADLDASMAIPVAEVWFCQGELLRASLSVLEADLRPPYWVWNYERADDTVYGYGVPWLYRNAQRGIDSIWLMLMHNLSVSSGPQVFVKAGIVKPMDGKYVIRGPKLWSVESEDVEDVSKAFRAEVIPNNATQLIDVLKLAMDLGDEEIALPAIAQGQPNEAVPTAAGLIQLLNASNIVQRRCAKTMDDELISPMVERFYVWNMLHGDDDRVKGDFAVAARGTSVLLHKDIKAQHLQVIAQITADPRFAPYLKPGEMLREMLDTADVSATLLLRTDQEAEALQQQQAQGQGASAADQAKAQALQAEVQIKQAQLQADQQKWQVQAQLQAQQMQLQHQQKMADIADRAEDRRSQIIMKQAELQIMAARLADDKNISLAEIESKLQIAQTQANLQQYLAGMNARMKAASVAGNEREMQLKLDPANRSGTGI